MADRPLESWNQHSVLDGVDHFTGIFALVVTAMAGLDIYFWLALHQAPRMSILWIPPMAVNMWRRTLTDEKVPRWPSGWYAALAAYSGVILGIVLGKGVMTWDDRWMAGFAALWVAISLWKATRREAGQ